MAKASIKESTIEPFIVETPEFDNKKPTGAIEPSNVNLSLRTQISNLPFSLKSFIRIISFILIIILFLSTLIPIIFGKQVAPEHTESIQRAVKAIHNLAILTVAGNFTR